jgi:hypothetical protein
VFTVLVIDVIDMVDDVRFGDNDIGRDMGIDVAL